VSADTPDRWVSRPVSASYNNVTMTQIAKLHFDDEMDRWTSICPEETKFCEDCVHLGKCDVYIVPDECDIAATFDSRFRKGEPVYPVFNGKRLKNAK